MILELNKYYPAISAVIIALLFLWWYIRYDLLLLNKIQRVLKVTAAKISELSSEEDNDKNIDRILSETGFKPVERAWDAYNRKSDKGDITEAFNAYDTVVIPASRRRAEAIPQVLVTLGILAVFGGLTAGMMSMPQSSEPAAMAAYLAKTAAGSLAAGMSGIMLSILFQLLDRRHYQSALAQLSDLCYTVNTKLIFKDIEAGQKSYIQELLERIEQEFRTGNDRAIDAIQGFTHKLSEFISGFGEKLTAVQSEGLQNIMQAFLEKLNGSAGDYIKELEASYARLSEAQKQSSEHISSIMKSAAVSSEQQMLLNSASEKVVENILACTDKITENTRIAAEAAEKTKEFAAVLSDMMQNAEQSEQDTASRFSEIINNMLQKLDTGLNGNIDKLGEASSKLLEELDNRVFSINVYTDVISKEIASLSGNLNTSVEVFSSQINDCIKKSYEAFDSSVADICDRLGTTASSIRDAVDELPKVLSGCTDEKKEAKVVRSEI